jgi:hypothetical protein
VTNNQYGMMTLQRDDATGLLTLLANTNATLLNPCFPSEVDARAVSVTTLQHGFDCGDIGGGAFVLEGCRDPSAS